MKATIGDIEIEYDTAGSGPPVLLVMGLSVAGWGWRLQIPALEEHHTVCWYDNRGCGKTTAPGGRYSTPQMADDAIGLMDHLGWESAHVVGVSMGGMVAQEIALRHRRRVRSLALIATHAGGPGTRPTWGGLSALVGVVARRGEGRIDAYERLLFPKPYRETCDREWLRDILRTDYGSPPPAQGRRGQVAAVFSHDTRDRLHQLAGLPTLVVRPGMDVLIPPTASDTLHAGIPGSTLLRFDDAGHGVIRQCAAELNAALLAHFSPAEAHHQVQAG